MKSEGLTRYLSAADCGEVYTSDNITLGITDAVAEDVLAVAVADADTVLLSLPATETVSTNAVSHSKIQRIGQSKPFSKICKSCIY